MNITDTAMNTPELSVVVPVYNEAANIEALLARLTPVLERVVASHEIIFVDDGSSDDTMETLRNVHAQDRRRRAVSFSRNFGKEIAIAAGLDHARGRAVVEVAGDPDPQVRARLDALGEVAAERARAGDRAG